METGDQAKGVRQQMTTGTGYLHDPAQRQWLFREAQRAKALREAAEREMERELRVLKRQGLPPRQAVLSERFVEGFHARRAARDRLRFLQIPDEPSREKAAPEGCWAAD